MRRAINAAAIHITGVYENDGVLPLTEVASIIAALPRPDQVWAAVIEFLAESEDLAGRVTAVTDEDTDFNGQVWPVNLPATISQSGLQIDMTVLRTSAWPTGHAPRRYIDLARRWHRQCHCQRWFFLCG